MKQKLTHFTARIKDKRVDLYYISIKQAKYFNPLAIDFRKVGVCKE